MILYIVKNVVNLNYQQEVEKDMIDEAGGSLPTEEEVAEFIDEASGQLE